MRRAGTLAMLCLVFLLVLLHVICRETCLLRAHILNICVRVFVCFFLITLECAEIFGALTRWRAFCHWASLAPLKVMYLPTQTHLIGPCHHRRLWSTCVVSCSRLGSRQVIKQTNLLMLARRPAEQMSSELFPFLHLHCHSLCISDLVHGHLFVS